MRFVQLGKTRRKQRAITEVLKACWIRCVSAGATKGSNFSLVLRFQVFVCALSLSFSLCASARASIFYCCACLVCSNSQLTIVIESGPSDRLNRRNHFAILSILQKSWQRFCSRLSRSSVDLSHGTKQRWSYFDFD